MLATGLTFKVKDILIFIPELTPSPVKRQQVELLAQFLLDIVALLTYGWICAEFVVCGFEKQKLKPMKLSEVFWKSLGGK